MGTIGDFRARFAAAHLKAVNEALNEVDNVEITKAIANEKKQVQFKTFLKNLAITGGNPEIEMKKILNNAGKTEAEAFAGKLYEYNTVEALKSNNSKEVGNSKFSKSLFSMDAKGIGPGELWLAWLVKDVVVSGGDKSYDITQGKLMYEVKSYTDTNIVYMLALIYLGT